MRHMVLGILDAGLIACHRVLRTPVDEAGALVWELTEIHTAGRDAGLSSRAPAPEREAAIIAALFATLDPASDLAVRL